MPEDATGGGTQQGASSGKPDAQPGAQATQQHGDGGGNAARSFSEAEVKSQVSAAINEARKSWKAEIDAMIADKTKDADTKLSEARARADEAERYANFVSTASGAGIGNTKSAYLVAKHGEYFDKRGNFEAERFRKDNPEFFGKPANANAGAGSGSGGAPQTMNDRIRAMAGRR